MKIVPDQSGGKVGQNGPKMSLSSLVDMFITLQVGNHEYSELHHISI